MPHAGSKSQRLYSADEVADIYGIRISTVYSAYQTERLFAIRNTLTNRLLFDPHHVDEWATTIKFRPGRRPRQIRDRSAWRKLKAHAVAG